MSFRFSLINRFSGSLIIMSSVRTSYIQKEFCKIKVTSVTGSTISFISPISKTCAGPYFQFIISEILKTSRDPDSTIKQSPFSCGLVMGNSAS